MLHCKPGARGDGPAPPLSASFLLIPLVPMTGAGAGGTDHESWFWSNGCCASLVNGDDDDRVVVVVVVVGLGNVLQE